MGSSKNYRHGDTETSVPLCVLCASVFIFSLLGCAPTEHKPKLEDISWLLGTWKTQGEERKMVENWAKESDTAMKGTGVFLSHGDTTYMEKLRIEMRNGDIFYVADVPQNPEPVPFKLTRYKDNEAVFENPVHDFPQRIIYALQPNGTLHARAEGGDGERGGGRRHARHGVEQSAGEPQAVEQPESERGSEAAGAPALFRPKDVLRGDKYNAAGDHGLDNTGRQPEHVQHRRDERNRVRERERADHLDQIPPARDREQQRSEKQQMIVAGEDMCYAVEQERASDAGSIAPFADARTRALLPVALDGERLAVSQQHAHTGRLFRGAKAHEVARLPGVAGREFELSQHILLQDDACRRPARPRVLEHVGQASCGHLGRVAYATVEQAPVCHNPKMRAQVFAVP